MSESLSQRAPMTRRNLGSLRTWLWGVTMVMSCGAILWGLRYTSLFADAFALCEVHITGNHQATQAEILRYLSVRPGDKIWTLNLESLRASILRHPWIKTCEVRRVLPQALEVHVTEHEARGVVALGGLYLVDEEAQLFAKESTEEMPYFPVITGLSRALYEHDQKNWRRLLQMGLDFTQAAKQNGLAIDEIALDEILGVTAMVSPHHIPARFGFEQFDLKIKRLKQVVVLLSRDGIEVKQFLLDNARHPEWVVVRQAQAIMKTPVLLGAR